MIPIHDDLLEVMDAVEIESPVHYSLLGEPREVTESAPAEASSMAVPSRLESALARDLYERLYFRPSVPHGPPRADALARRELVAALSVANTGQGTWQPGWTVRRIDEDGLVVVVKDDVGFWVPTTDLRVPEGLIRPGEACRVRVAKELRHLMPGFYVAIGDAEGDPDDHSDRLEPLVRYYWHLMPDAAVAFMAAVTALFNSSRIPFRVKVLSDPNAYHRADAGVLYVRRRCHRRIDVIIAELYSTVASGLRTKVPLFTKRLASGLGFAEDPASALSFGEHRCQLAAAALWQSFTRGEFGRDARAAALASGFHQLGLDPLRPYLGPGSEDVDALQPWLLGMSRAETTQVSPNTEGTAELGSARNAATAPLEAAASIGRALCRSVFWDLEGLLCNWIGRSTAEGSKLGGPITPTADAISPDLYAGSAGIALFLAQLHSLTGDPHFRRAALGAIARSIRQLGRLPSPVPISPLSFFCGHLGVAYAARRVGALTGYGALDAQARAILDRVAEATSAAHELDVIGGNAGAIPALLWLGRSRGFESCRGLAITLGEELCGTAVRRGTTCIWEPGSETDTGIATGPLTGLSHGAAGIGLALLELHAATGRTDFLDTAHGAFTHVDSLFDAQQDNWADRRLPEGSDSAASTPSFSSAWCHGAPGIALSRLRAAALDPKQAENHLVMARVAIGTTLKTIEKNLEDPRADASLCHGLSGLGEVVLIASRLLNDPSYHGRTVDLALTLIDRHASSGDWPSGVPSGGPNPSLMLGLAGIGYWLLRLHDPAGVPPFLLLIPSENS